MVVLPFEPVCRQPAGPFEGSVPYGFVVTIETPIEARLPIRQEVVARVRPRVTVRRPQAG